MTISATYGRNVVAAAYGALATHGALYTTTPGPAAGTEPAGIYAREPLTWSAPTDGVITASAVFDIPAGTTVLGGGVHTALTGGNYMDGKGSSPVTFEDDDTLTVNFTYTQV